MSGVLRRLFGGGVPEQLAGVVEPDENVVASAVLRGGGFLFATSYGLWVPGEDGPRRVGWHLVSKVTWGNGVLEVVEAREVEAAGEAVVLADQAPMRFVLERTGRLPDVVHIRVNGSIRSRHRREMPGGGAWFVQRKVPGRDGVVLQVRPDPGVDHVAVRRVAAEVAERIRQALE